MTCTPTGDGDQSVRDESVCGDSEYYCVFLTISSHPGLPLRGNQLSVSGEFPVETLNYDAFSVIRDTAEKRFTVDEWQTEVYVARVYVTGAGDPVRVAWEETPQLYEHGCVSNPVPWSEIPNSSVPVPEE